MPEPEELFERFARLANPGGLHPLDLERLLDYIIVTHRSDVPVDLIELRRVMGEKGFEPDVVERVVALVEDGRELLRRYDGT